MARWTVRHGCGSWATRCGQRTTPGSGQTATPPGSFTASLVRAIDASGGDAALDPADLVEAEPVDDGRPISRTRSRVPGGVVELAIGAPEVIVGLAVPAEQERAAWLERIEGLAATGERLVALAGRPDGGRWEVRALIGFADPLRDRASGRRSRPPGSPGST